MISNLWQRIISASILLPLLILLIFKGPLSFINLIIFVVLVLSLIEWLNLFALPKTYHLLGIVSYLSFFISSPNPWSFTIYFLFFLFAFIPLLLRYNPELFRNYFSPFFLGLTYLYFSLSLLKEILFLYSRDYLFFLLMVVFATDTGAYLVGKFWGKTPFFPSISPKKTWEGFWGGLLFAYVVGYLLNAKFNLFPLRVCLIIIFFLALAGTVGDLFESTLKRSVGKKDSGCLIPGHGGLLDRIDGLLLAIPAYHTLLRILG